MTKKRPPPKGKMFDLSHEIDTAFDPWTIEQLLVRTSAR
jgi:hypothetical protein